MSSKPAAPAAADPLEVELAYKVRPCRTCSFFWPENLKKQPYGPYSAFDFTMGEPSAPDPTTPTPSYPWLKGVTRPPAFPDPEIMDGCRKAPIMTIGINPNLTSFSPGQTGAAWAYPSFANDAKADAVTKYAYYYRYRSVYQERFNSSFITPYLLPQHKVVAKHAGTVVGAERTTDSPSYSIKVRYAGDSEDTTIPLAGELGGPQWVLLFNPEEPDNAFKAGDVIAAKLDVPAGKSAEIYRAEVEYYAQFLPVLNGFEKYLHAHGHAGAKLHMGEDVCQLDMVACASPHWDPGFLGGTTASVDTIIHNCVAKNAWSMKQLVQTKPAVLFLVGESSYDMFVESFGKLIKRAPALSERPADGAFTLLRECTDLAQPCYFQFSTTIDGTTYSLKTRLVITPHFSYASNFVPQFRLSPEQWKQLQSAQPKCAHFLQTDTRLTYCAPATPEDYTAFSVKSDAAGVLAEIEHSYAACAAELRAAYYDAHAMMGTVLSDMYEKGALSYGKAGGSALQALARNDGSCQFCVNDHWKFPLGCPYGKPDEKPPAPGFLEKVTAAIVAAGKRSA